MGNELNPKGVLARRERTKWPAGATVGLVLVAAACLGIGATLYSVAGPRDIMADDGTDGR